MRTASSGRIRLDQNQATFLLEALNENRHRLVIRRASAKANGEGTYSFQRAIDRIDGILGELHRTMEEMGWPHG